MIDFDKVEFEIDDTLSGTRFMRARLRIHVMTQIDKDIDIGVLKDHLRQCLWHEIYDIPAPKPKMI